jgi:hypothetical protein
MDRRLLLWTLVAFFGASVAFSVVQDLTRDEPIAVTIALEVVVLALIIGFIVLLVRRNERRGGS